MSHLIKIYAVCKFSNFPLWYLKSKAQHFHVLDTRMCKRQAFIVLANCTFFCVQWLILVQKDHYCLFFIRNNLAVKVS